MFVGYCCAINMGLITCLAIRSMSLLLHEPGSAREALWYALQGCYDCAVAKRQKTSGSTAGENSEG